MVKKDLLEPKVTQSICPQAKEPLWVYRYTDPKENWVLSISTHGAPQSGKFSLGGFRIVPAARAALPGFSSERESIELGIGMEEKVFWSRLFQIAGPRGMKLLDRVVGGKCVLLPTAGCRVGEPKDREMLQWGVSCLRDMEETSGVNLVTGQDLGHGMLSDGKTSSLQFLSDNFLGSVIADTGKPTGEGNFYLMIGALKSLGLDLSKVKIGVIGYGNIGEHLTHRLREHNIACEVLEASEEKRKQIAALGIKTWKAEDKAEFLKQPFDALAVNALGGTLDMTTVKAICNNPVTRFISGCENLVMPDPAGAELFRTSKRVYCHTELCGMMGYLTAVECYLCRKENVPFDFTQMYQPSQKLQAVGEKVVKAMVASNFAKSFEDTARECWA